MSSSYKLTYYPMKGLAESIRFLLSYGGIDYEDFRFERENWPSIKPDMPFGEVPVLEVNGKKAHQSIAICRYLAKQVKLTGANDWEDLEIDAIIDTINDLRTKIIQYLYEVDPARKETLKTTLFNETIPYYLERLDAIAKTNKGHLAVGKLTWADLHFVARFDSMRGMDGKKLTAGYPNLEEVEKNVLSIPSIQKWIKKRPEDIAP